MTKTIDNLKMKISPIIFSSRMVQAILDNKKTQTRRIVKPQPDDDGLWDDTNLPRSLESTLKGWNGTVDETGESKEFKCPYGQPGDILWVRESFTYLHKNHVIDRNYVYKEEMKDLESERIRQEYLKAGYDYKWKPSIHMPKAAARIFLKITGIRVERLQEISEFDAIDEGIESMETPFNTVYRHYLKDKFGPSPIHSFQTLWSKINGAESWEANPWVWVISFERVEKPPKAEKVQVSDTTMNHKDQMPG